MVAHLLVGIAWEALADHIEVGVGSGKVEYPARFPGGFAGEVKLIRPPGPQPPRRLGVGSKWNPARSSYFVRSYLYCSKEGFFRTLAEIEISAGTVGEGLGPVEEELRTFAERAIGRLDRRREDP